LFDWIDESFCVKHYHSKAPEFATDCSSLKSFEKNLFLSLRLCAFAGDIKIPAKAQSRKGKQS
jgi:hypothetical protein